MKALVKDGKLVRKIRQTSNITGNSGVTYGNIALWDRQALVDDGIYDYIDARVPDGHRLTSEDNVVDVAAGTVTYVITTEPKPLQTFIDAAIARVKALRMTALEKWTKNSGVSAIYAENYLAAAAHLDGSGGTTIMRDSRTATAYLTALGAKLGMSADGFAAYIVNENQTVVGPQMADIEDRYLALCYAGDPANGIVPISMMTDKATIDQAVQDYQLICFPPKVI